MREHDFRRPENEQLESQADGADERLRMLMQRRQLQRKASGQNLAPDAGAAVERASQSSGEPLPAPLQQKFERSLGADLSGVRVHSGGASAAAADAVDARAYTVGHDIHMGAGEYQPGTP